VASYEAHIDQAKKNLSFLVEINSKPSLHWDWEVTVCFYIAVHIANAHLAKVANLHYRTHESVKIALSPNPLSITQLPEDIYLSYAKLEGLSRRSRYLCHNEPKKNDAETAFFTYEKHFSKAVKNLDKFLNHFSNLYGISFGNPLIKCADLDKNSSLVIFKT
jgi:hypothetical protein